MLKQLAHANSSRTFLGECVLLLFILDPKAFGGDGTWKCCKGLIWKVFFFNLNVTSAFLVTFYVGNNSLRCLYYIATYMEGCATLSIIRLVQLLIMLPTFSCLGWNFPCWVSPSGWISWESFNKNTWTIPGNERRGKYYILFMFIKAAASTQFRNHSTYVFWSRELNY